MTEAPKYVVLNAAFLPSPNYIGSRRVKPGEEVVYNGAPGPGLYPLNDAARAAAASYEQENPGSSKVRAATQGRFLASVCRATARKIAEAEQGNPT